MTEEITGVDLVQLQLRLAGGASLAELDLPASPPRGVAVQVRINAERIGTDGSVRPSGGVVTAFELPSGPGIRVDSAGHAGYRTNPRFDSLLAKLVAHVTSAGAAAAFAKAARALDELVIAGVPTNVPFLRRLLRHPAVVANDVSTRFVEDHLDELAADGDASGTPVAGAVLAGARVDATDPLAILAHGKSGTAATLEDELATAPEGTVAITAPMQGSVVSIAVGEGEPVHVGQAVLVMEAMKMEHVIESSVGGVVRQVLVAVGDAVFEGSPLVLVEEGDVGATASSVAEEADLDAIRADLDEVRRRQSLTHDGDRPDAVARRRATGQRTARENVDDLCDPGSFVEYGSLAIAAQRRRRPVQELIERTPADGLVAGIGRINGALVGDARARCVVMSYDYTVLAGTQGLQNHRKKDRMFELAEEWRLPVAIFAEGGGGRPGDTDASAVAGLDTMAFHLFGRLSGLVPLVGIVSGRCFAGNAALLGCCDVVIASRDANIGMGGPAMIEGGGLGVFRPEEIGPASVQAPNGVIDVLVDDEAEAVRVAKRYLSYFQGPLDGWTAAEQRRLRRLVGEPAARLRRACGDRDARRRRLGARSCAATSTRHGHRADPDRGPPPGLIANNLMHLGGAIDSDGADKAARFLQLCDAFDIPVLMLCDAGDDGGPEVEKTALVRHCCRLFVVGASVTVLIFTIVPRKGTGWAPRPWRGQLQGAGVHCVVADRRVRRHGSRALSSSATATS